MDVDIEEGYVTINHNEDRALHLVLSKQAHQIALPFVCAF